MPSTGFILPVRKVVGIFEGAGFLHKNVIGRDSCPLALSFDDLLIVDVVFSCLVVKADKLIGIAEFLEFQGDILINLKLPLADGSPDLDLKVLQVALPLLPDALKYLKRNLLYGALPSGMNDPDNSAELIMKDNRDTVGSEGTKQEIGFVGIQGIGVLHGSRVDA